ncbi:unnamed protein product [Alopecurus aequalis]
MDPHSSPEIEADESIMQSLNQINSEYPVVQSPARPDAPVFDATPGGVVASRVTNPELFAPTMSPAPECTPMWEDTQSQSVDGTEVVTQPQDTQDQLDKYYAARAAREAKFQKEMLPQKMCLHRHHAQ